MGWALTVEGRSDTEAVLLLLEDRAEAESIASEIRTRGTPVVVIPYAVMPKGIKLPVRS